MIDDTSPPLRPLMVGLPGIELDAATQARLEALQPAGVILFRRNLETPEQTCGLLLALARLPVPPRLVALDQEGGAVSRLEPWIGPTPPAVDLAARGSLAVARFGRLTGQLLSALGFNVDFAPVVDLCAANAGNGIDGRSYGEDPELVVELAGQFLDALQSTGVAGCLKHFPGLGCTAVDSHVELPTADRSAEELDRFELEPYRHLGPRAACVMVGHGHYPAWNPGDPGPASGSATIVRGILRDRLGYGGLIVTDDLLMGAVADLDVDGRFAVESLAAGCDLLLYCADLDRAAAALAALTAEAAVNPFLRRRLREAASAIDGVARRFPLPAPDLAEWRRRREAIAEFAAEA